MIEATDDVIEVSSIIGKFLKLEPKLYNKYLIDKFGEDMVYSLYGYLLLSMISIDIPETEN